jgi:hypothetical protein
MTMTQDRTKTLKPYKNHAAVRLSLYLVTKTTSLTPIMSHSSQATAQRLTETKICRSKFKRGISLNLMT